MSLIPARAIYAVTGTQSPAGMLDWAVDRGQPVVKQFITRMVLRMRTTLGSEKAKQWSIFIPGKGTQTANMNNARGDSKTDTAIKGILWLMRYPTQAHNELFRMGAGLPHGLDGVTDSFGPTTQDQALGFIFDRTNAGPGRPHSVDPVVTPAVIIAILGLIAAVAPTILSFFLSKKNDVMITDPPVAPTPQGGLMGDAPPPPAELPPAKMGGLDQKTLLIGAAAVAAILLLKK